MNKRILMAAMAVGLTACQSEQPAETTQSVADPKPTTTKVVEAKPETPSLAAQFENAATTLFHARPVNATVYGVSEKLVGGPYNHRLDDYSPKAEAGLRSKLRQINAELATIKSENAVDKDNLKVMRNINRYYAGHENFDIGYIDVWMGLSPFVVNQINGPLIDVPNSMATNQAITNVEEAKAYLERLDGYDGFMQGVMAKLSADTIKGWIAPKVIIAKTIKSLEAFIAPPVIEHPLYTNFEAKVSKLDGLSDAEKTAMCADAAQHIENGVYAGYRMMIEAQKQLLERATEESGIWAQPNGAAYYADAVKMLGDTDLDPEAIHELGLSEVARIHAEMDTILKANGHVEGTVGERMLAINDDPAFLYEDSEAGRTQLLEDLNGYIEEINEKMPEWFATEPPYAVEVRKFPKSREASAPGGMYTAPPIDGSAPGIYWINLRDIKANPKFDLKTLTYHEANPGHHWQIALNLAQDHLPMLRRMAPYNAFAEGWALYSELVAKEMGMYENDPYSDLGRLKAELFRAVRLVVDTGLHHKKWSREEAIKYMAENAGVVESDVVAEIERYMVWPGQALGYKLGMIKMVELRESAQRALGDQFDIKAFHDLILLGGAVPMSVLEENVDNWVRSQKGL